MRKKKYRAVTTTERETIHRIYQQGGWTSRQLHEEFNIPMGSLYSVTGTGYWFWFRVSFDTQYVLCLVSSIV